MTFSLTQHTSVDAGSPTGGSTTLAYGSNNASGALLVCICRIGFAAQTVTVTDTAGNTWATAREHSDVPGANTFTILYAMNAVAGANTITVHWQQATAISARFAIAEYAGGATSSALDQVNSANGSSTSVASGSVTPTTDNQLVIGLQGSSNGRGYTQTAGLTMEEQQPAGANAQKILYVDVIQTTATAINNTATLNTTDTWGACIATFKAAAGGAAVLPSVPTMPTRVAP